jgi:RNA polymerase sigma-70 factor (ECF subfamily)
MAEPSGGAASRESSLALLTRAKAGDAQAFDALLARYRPRLVRWAHRRLPAWTRDLADTDDLIQDTLVKTIRNFDQFVATGGEGFQNYLRVAVRNAIRDHVRRGHRRPEVVAIDPSMPSGEASPLDRAMTQHRLDRYESALEQLAPEERDAVVARLEFGFTHVELAAVLGKATPDAARKLCVRATTRLLWLMQERGPVSTR